MYNLRAKFVSIKIPGFIIISLFLVLILLLFTLADGNRAQSHSDLIFIHHSIGQHWLAKNKYGFLSSLLNQSFITEINNTYYDVDIENDPGRPDSLTGRSNDCYYDSHDEVAGSCTDPVHWLYWMNDYLDNIKHFDSPDVAGKLNNIFAYAGNYNPDITNRIIMIKSGFHTNDIVGPTDPAGVNPFAASREPTPSGGYTLTAYIENYKAVYTRNPDANYVSSENGYTYLPLDEVFTNNRDTLFIVITAPPFKIGGSDTARMHYARVFNTWLANDWINSYPYDNVVVFDYFDFLAYSDNYPDPNRQNRLKEEYGGLDNVHPNDFCHQQATATFIPFLQNAWEMFTNAPNPKPRYLELNYLPYLSK